MLNTTELRETYRKLDDAALVEIISKPAGYRKEAVEIAREELASRNLSAEQLKQSEEILRERQAGAWTNKGKHAKEMILGKVARHASKWDPLADVAYEESFIRWMAIAFLAFAVFALWSSGILGFFFSDILLEPVFTIVVALEPLMLLLSAILFFLRKRAGWILLVVTMATRITAFFFFFVKASLAGYAGNMLYMPNANALSILLAAGFLVAAWRPFVKEAYKIKKEQAWTWFSISMVIGVIYLLTLLSL